MNKIRQNKEEEIIYARAKFDMPRLYKWVYFIMVAIFVIIAIVSLIKLLNMMQEWKDVFLDYAISAIDFMTIIIPIIFAVCICVLYVKHKNAIKKGECVVSNKTIRGKTVSIFSKKNYNYRLDEIDNVETIASFGIAGIMIHFSQGKKAGMPAVSYASGQQLTAGSNILKIYYLINAQEMYEKLSTLISEVKNEFDVEVDIEMKKIEAETKKAEAFSKIAEKVGEKNEPQNNGGDYISQMERLYSLKEKGVITEEEFNSKKKELL